MDKKKWIRFGLLSAAVVLYACAVFFCHSAKAHADLTYLVLSQSVDAAAAEEMFAREKQLEEPMGFCFWGEKAGQTVFCRETGSYAQVTQVLLSGNPGLMGAGALAWQSGCFLDEATALALFGTADCGGQTLWQGDAAYPVLGTISALGPTMLAVAAERDGSILNRCVLSAPAEKGDALGQQFLMRWGLQGTRIDFYPLWTAVHNLLLLLPCILLLSAFSSCVKRSNRMILSLSQIVVLMALLWFLGSRMIILQSMIPSRWSDFSFWGSWWEMQKENFHRILLTPMGNTHLQMLLDMVKSMLSAMAAFLLAMRTRRRRSHADTAD